MPLAVPFPLADSRAMKHLLHLAIIPLLLLSSPTATYADDEKQRLAELDAYWTKVSRSVGEGDFADYSSTCHPKAVLVSGNKKTSYPLADALKRWKVEFDDTKAGKRKSSVTFRFAHRYGDATTAHESGIFLYTFQPAGEPLKKEYVHFEALLVKEDGNWLIMMEYQKSSATEAEWKKLK